jgi:hypothetical protein
MADQVRGAGLSRGRRSSSGGSRRRSGGCEARCGACQFGVSWAATNRSLQRWTSWPLTGRDRGEA